MAGRRPGCGCDASLLPVRDRPWLVYDKRRCGSRVGCLACGGEWKSRDLYVYELRESNNCTDSRRTFSRRAGGAE